MVGLHLLAGRLRAQMQLLCDRPHGIHPQSYAEEIADQVLFWRQQIRRDQLDPLDNVIYMGMGEPFLNREEVFTSLRALTDPEQFGMGDRHLAVSTAGMRRASRSSAKSSASPFGALAARGARRAPDQARPNQ